MSRGLLDGGTGHGKGIGGDGKGGGPKHLPQWENKTTPAQTAMRLTAVKSKQKKARSQARAAKAARKRSRR